MTKEYAVYKGDKDILIFIGTLEECMKRFNVDKVTVQWWSYQQAFDRAHRKYKNKGHSGMKWAIALWKVIDE